MLNANKGWVAAVRNGKVENGKWKFKNEYSLL
jgi:hypothetical protein